AALYRAERGNEDERNRCGGALHAVILPSSSARTYVWRVKVTVLTTSYPRSPDDPAGRFVADAVEHVRARGVEVDVVSPATFRHFGLAYGHGIVGNIRARPWRLLLVPAFLWSFRRAAATRDCDLVHA